MTAQVQKSHTDLRTYFLLEFTKELIRNTKSYKSVAVDIGVRKALLEKKEKQKAYEQRTKEAKEIIRKGTQEIIKEKMGRDSQHVSQLKKMSVESKVFNPANPFQSFFTKRTNVQRATPSILQIAESRLPPTVQHLRPVPMQVEVNLKKLSPLVKDPFVKIIECNGPDENIYVIGTMGRKKTGIILNKEEVDEIIKIFSENTKIPIEEGVNKIVFGKLVLSAIVSEVIGSKFIIKKMNLQGFAPPA